MYDRIAVKEHAKARMRVSDPRCWKMMLLWAAVAVLIPSLVEALAGNTLNEVYGMIFTGEADYYDVLSLLGGSYLVEMALTLIVAVYQCILDFGAVDYALKLHRGEESGVANLFGGFAMIGRVLGARVLVLLRIMGIGLLGGMAVGLVISVCAMFSEMLALVLGVLGYLAVTALMIFVGLNYVLTTLVLADHPDLRAGEAVARSVQLMQGSKGRYVVLYLSFFGWAILCSLLDFAFSAVIGSGVLTLPAVVEVAISFVCMLPFYLWLTPYQQISYAAFYDEMKKEHDRPQTALPFEPLDEFPEL